MKFMLRFLCVVAIQVCLTSFRKSGRMHRGTVCRESGSCSKAMQILLAMQMLPQASLGEMRIAEPRRRTSRDQAVTLWSAQMWTAHFIGTMQRRAWAYPVIGHSAHQLHPEPCLGTFAAPASRRERFSTESGDLDVPCQVRAPAEACLSALSC